MCLFLPSGVVRVWVSEGEELAARKLFVRSFAADMQAMRDASSNTGSIESNHSGTGTSSDVKSIDENRSAADYGSDRLLDLYGLPTDSKGKMPSSKWSLASVAGIVSSLFVCNIGIYFISMP
jgi:hypothetical protein